MPPRLERVLPTRLRGLATGDLTPLPGLRQTAYSQLPVRTSFRHAILQLPLDFQCHLVLGIDGQGTGQGPLALLDLPLFEIHLSQAGVSVRQIRRLLDTGPEITLGTKKTPVEEARN